MKDLSTNAGNKVLRIDVPQLWANPLCTHPDNLAPSTSDIGRLRFS